MGAIANDWLVPMGEEFKKPYYKKLYEKVKEEYQTRQVFPDANDIFNAFDFTPLSEVKVVILGQDPYHNEGQAHGLCFSVQDGIPKPPSLENMLKELKSDLGYDPPKSGNLTKWAKEGVLMMNTALTVRAHQANSHANCGWSWFTDSVISILSEQKERLVFLLWGGNARRKVPLIDKRKHYILECAHPSPLSAFNGFFGCRHYSKTNEYLTAHGLKPIDWKL